MTQRITALAVLVVISAVVLVVVGFRAVDGWTRAADEVAGRRAQEAVDTFVAVLSRDMRGAQQLVLGAAERDGLVGGNAVDLLHPIASAFARFPYTDVFFSWQPAQPPSRASFFARAERRPAWLTAAEGQAMYPVVVATDPEASAIVVARLSRDAAQGRRFSIFEVALHGVTYQVVATVDYSDRLRQTPTGALGFLVSLEWARANYFGDLARQLTRTGSGEPGLRLSVLDERERGVVADVPASVATASKTARRTFTMGFYEPFAVSVDPPSDLTMPTWTAVATSQDDIALRAASQGARRTLATGALMALVLVGSLLLAWRAAQASATLAEIRSDFVSAVTHEIKTPIANLRAINETLASERSTMEMSREYAQMGIREASRLSRLIDNLLAYARITDVADAYHFEPVDVLPIVERSVRGFSSNLAHAGFAVDVDIAENLPWVNADATAIGLALNNLIDNAIRYSKDTRQLRISATARGAWVSLRVADAGVGIPADEVGKVTRKFARGRRTDTSGSGLGLAIVDRIVQDHGGRLHITSEPGTGTVVTLELPIAPATRSHQRVPA